MPLNNQTYIGENTDYSVTMEKMSKLFENINIQSEEIQREQQANIAEQQQQYRDLFKRMSEKKKKGVLDYAVPIANLIGAFIDSKSKNRIRRGQAGLKARENIARFTDFRQRAEQKRKQGVLDEMQLLQLTGGLESKDLQSQLAALKRKRGQIETVADIAKDAEDIRLAKKRVKIAEDVAGREVKKTPAEKNLKLANNIYEKMDREGLGYWDLNKQEQAILRRDPNFVVPQSRGQANTEIWKTRIENTEKFWAKEKSAAIAGKSSMTYPQAIEAEREALAAIEQAMKREQEPPVPTPLDEFPQQETTEEQPFSIFDFLSGGQSRTEKLNEEIEKSFGEGYTRPRGRRGRAIRKKFKELIGEAKGFAKKTPAYWLYEKLYGE